MYSLPSIQIARKPFLHILLMERVVYLLFKLRLEVDINNDSLSVVEPRVSRFYNVVIYLNDETIFQVSIDCDTKSAFVA